MEHNQETCGCPRCVVARGPGNGNRYYEQALSYLTRPIEYLTATEYFEMAKRADAQPRNYGAVNVYTCPTCGKRLITIDRAAGVTPAFKVCDGEHPHGTGSVNASMHSAWYRVPAEMANLATHEWFRPSYEYYRSITDVNSERYVREGGLLFRKIGDILPEGHKFMTGFQDRIPTPSPFDEGDIEDLRELKERVKLFQKGDRRDV